MKLKFILASALVLLVIYSTVSLAQTNYIASIARNISIGNALEIFVDTTNSRVGILTSSPGTRLDVRGNINASGININNTVSGNGGLLNVSSDGSIGAWSTNANALPVSINYHTSVVANGYVYVIGGDDGTDAKRYVYYARLNANGSTERWVNSTNLLPLARQYHTSVVANGYIYVIGGRVTGGSDTSTVYYAKLNSDGSTGVWQTTTALPAARAVHASVVANGYVYVIGGGFTGVDTVYYAKLNADGTVGSWQTAASLPVARHSHASVVANGYVYVIGGGAESSVTSRATIYYAQLNATNGNISSWTNQTSNLFIDPRDQHEAVVVNGYVYVMGGQRQVSGSAQEIFSSVVYAKLNADGTTGPWTTTTALPNTRYWHSSAVYNGYMYTLGSASAPQNAIYYASVGRIMLGVSLDLIGLTSANLTSGAGEEGGTVYAGSLYASNKLEVGGNAMFWGGLSVNGSVTMAPELYVNGTITSGDIKFSNNFYITEPTANSIAFKDNNDNTLLTTADNFLEAHKPFRVYVSSASFTCDSGREGFVYFDDSSKHFKGCNGSNWVVLDD